MRPYLIETIRIEADGRMPLLPLHIERLSQTVQALNYRWSIDRVQRYIARELAKIEHPTPHVLYLNIQDNGDITSTLEPTLPLLDPPIITLSSYGVSTQDPELKLNIAEKQRYLLAKQWLHEQTMIHDSIFFNERGELTEGIDHHLYLLIDGHWYTPPLASGINPGVQRMALLDDDLVIEKTLYRHDILNAERTRLSSDIYGWIEAQWMHDLPQYP